MDWAGWATFGFVATVALTTIMVAAQLAGRSRMDMLMMLGTMFVEDAYTHRDSQPDQQGVGLRRS